MKPLTAEEIAELRRLDAEGIAAPWETDADGDNIDGSDCVVVRGPKGNPAIAAVWTLHPDARLASAARNALPRLLDEVERSRALLKRIEYVPLGIEEPWYKGCPSCKAPQQVGQTHKPGCELAALLGG